MIELNDPHPALRLWREGPVQHLDVRDYLREGGRPYSLLMGTVRQLAPGEVLVVHALFDPQPLRRQIRRLGLTEECRQAEPDHWLLTVARREPPASGG